MAFTDTFIRRPVLAIVVSLLILLVGVASAFILPLRQYPMLESATIMVDTSYPGATQAVMQGFVTSPISQAIATANGIEYLTSTSSQGRSQIKAKLVLNADADRAMTEILAKIQQVKYRLPEGVSDPIISKITDGAAAIQYIAFVSDTVPVYRLTDFVTRVAQPRFTAIPGVASADIGDGQALAMRIWMDPVKLTARGMTASDLAQALLANNVQAAPGQLKGPQTVLNITATTDLRSIDDFRTMVVKSGEGGIVRLADVATVELGGQNYDTHGTDSARRAVFIAINPTPDGNPLEIIAAAKELIVELQRIVPTGVEIVNSFDYAHFVNASIDEVVRSLVEAIAIVVVVIFLFMGSMRAVFIPVITIPLSLIGTAALMLAFGLSINLLTLLAMVLAIGLVVDDAIVVVENIHRHMEEGLPPVQAALVGAREIVGPVIAMTITLAAVYTPIGVMGGLTGALFREFAFTLAAAVIVSGVIALTLSPMMCATLLKPHDSEGRLARRLEQGMEALARAYDRLLGLTLAARPAVVLFALVVLGAIAVFYRGAARELAPPEDHGYVFVAAEAPQYAGVNYTARYGAELEAMFRTFPEYRSSWYSSGTDGQNNGFGGIILSDWSQRERAAKDVMEEINQRASGLLGVNATAFLENPLPAGTGGLPVQMVVRSSDEFQVLYEQLEAIKGAAWKSGLFVYVDSDLAFDSPEARISIDRAKAADLGVSMGAIAEALAVSVGENYVNRFNYQDRSYDVIAQVPLKDRLSPSDLGRYHVRTQSGALVSLATVTKVETFPQPNRLPQFNQMNSATLSAVLAPGVTMGQAVDFLQSQPMPPGVTLDWLGDSRQFVTEGDRLTTSFVFALIVIFLVLTAQFESFRDPLVILVSVPLAICGALAPLYFGATTLNIYTQIGLVTLIGLISKHGILMVTFANQIREHEGLDRMAAIRRAAGVRLRPILMTTAAMVVGLVPLLFAAGAGAASRFAIGLVVVTGMLVGTLFTLFVLPTIYTFLSHADRKVAEEPKASEAVRLRA